MTDWIWRWWWLEVYLQWAVLVINLVGVTVSAIAFWITWQRWVDLGKAKVNGRRQATVRLHLITHVGIGLSQLFLVFISLGTVLLPAIPVTMYTSPAGQMILTMLLLRKIARLIISLALLWVSDHTVRWLRYGA